MSYQPASKPSSTTHVPWNKGKLTGQKHPCTLKQIWEIRIRLRITGRARDLALFNLGIDSKLRYCLIRLRVSDIAHGVSVTLIGANPSDYGTHPLRRSTATLVYAQTKNLRAVRLLLGHTELEPTLHNPGGEVDDMLEIAEQANV